MMLHILIGMALALGQVQAETPAAAPVPRSAPEVGAETNAVPAAQPATVSETAEGAPAGAATEAGTAAEAAIAVPLPGFSPGKTDQATTDASQQPASRDRRGLPPAFESPPFPGSEFQGLPLIGVREDTGMQFLMKQLQGTPAGDWLLTHRIKIYGWIDVGANLSSSNQSNFPVAYDVYPNTVYLDQVNLRFERVLDTAQTDHIDWGFKFDNIYGIDVRYTVAKGVFSEQTLKHNRTYAYDPVQWYGLLYIPNVAEGLVLKVGRWVSPPDIEAELALENYMHTHSITYSYDPYTQFGLQASLRLSPQWMVQAGIVAINDIAPWISNNKPTGMCGVRWVSKDNNDSVYLCLNSINDGRYTANHDNLQDICGTWTHKFNERISTMTEMWYMWQINAQKGGTENDGPFKLFGGPSGGGAGTIIPGVANEIALLNYTEFLLDKWNYITVRNEAFEDFRGQRTGFQTMYSTHAIGWAHYLGQNPNIQIRPEVDYDHAYNARAFDAGRRKNQFLLAADLLIRF